MNLAMADSLKVYDILKGAQIPELQARAITRAIRESESEMGLSIAAVLDQRLAVMATKDDLRVAISEVKTELLRWMFIFWTGQMAATVGIVFAGFKVWK
jgi:uncharacterized membrane protein